MGRKQMIARKFITSFLTMLLFFSVKGFGFDKLIQGEGLSEDCSIEFSQKKIKALEKMESNAHSNCAGGSLQQLSTTQFDRYLIPCPGNGRVFGVAATADFKCWLPW